jgi:hypothetical protein
MKFISRGWTLTDADLRGTECFKHLNKIVPRVSAYVSVSQRLKHS